MNEVVPVPIDELRRVAAANTGLVAAARRLADLAAQADPALKDKMLASLGEILSSSEAISGAVRTAGYLRTQRRA
ncbi:MAG: hypothetical protein KGL52_11375 [Rhodospirillales bacterium]|jgi:hypothetical protein|nr:hypothetical protein [Rhodospirillales bacterium]